MNICVVCDARSNDSYRGVPVCKDCWYELLENCGGDWEKAFKQLIQMQEDREK